MITAAQFRQVLLFLFLSAVLAQLVHAQVGHGTVGQANRGGSAADLLHGDRVGQVAHVTAAVLLLHGDTQQAHIAEFLPQVGGEFIVPVDVCRPGSDFLLAHLVDRVAQHLYFFAQAEVESGVSGVHGGVLSVLFVG